MNKDNLIIEKAIEKFHTQTGLAGTWKPVAGEIDGKLHFNLNGNKLNFFVQVKKELRQYQIPQLLEIEKRNRPLMVVADRIFPKLKETLRHHKIGYIDTAGNIYINTKNNFILLEGNKPTTEEKPVTNRAFTKTGLKTVFFILLQEDALNMPHRKLADATGVALGNIKNVIEGLKGAGFILQVNKKTMRLQNKKALLERWINGYRETLKPALHIGNFRFWEKEKLLHWQDLPIEKGETFWGSEPAAQHLTNYLRPEIITVYTNQNKTAIMPKWTLVPDEKGNVELYKKFWKDEQGDLQQYAPTLLVYADLLITDDPRCIETAEMIYTKYLQHAFE